MAYRWNRRIALAIALALASPRTAAAQEPGELQLVVIPSECTPYLVVPGGARTPMYWNQLLSFAACIQDASIAQIETGADLRAALEELESRLIPSLELYVKAADGGPGDVQLRAAYQVAMTYVALMVRARASIAQVPRLRTRLESELEPVKRAALAVFELVDRVAGEDPAIARDPVTAYMVRSARQVAYLLKKDLERSRPDLQILHAAR